jgi:hypothetical protein
VPEFDSFIAIDWSGAKSNYSDKIQVARCAAGNAAPSLVTQRGGWSRAAVQDFVQQQSAASRCLIGFDFSFAPPFVDHGCYLPGRTTPSAARQFWAYVDCQCSADNDLGAASFVDQTHRDYFYLGASCGPKANFQRWRRCEQVFNASGGGKSSSIFDAIGAAQVAKASFAGMRLLHQLGDAVAIWPFDHRPRQQSIVVELYCRAFIKMAVGTGTKLRTTAALNQALQQLGSQPVRRLLGVTDDKSDAIIAAAGLRAIANNATYWRPGGLTSKVARTEGWTFGVK